MIKLVKFNLLIDGQRCRTVEDLRNNFNLLDILEHFESGKLEKWLKVRKYDTQHNLKSIEKDFKIKQIAEKICEIFDITISNEILNDEIEIYKLMKKDISDEKGNKKALVSLQKENQKLKAKLNVFYEEVLEKDKIQKGKEDKETWKDNKTGLVWPRKYSAIKLTWEDAEIYVSDLNKYNYLGYNDWKIPTETQLKSISHKKDNLEFGATYFWAKGAKTYNSTYHLCVPIGTKTKAVLRAVRDSNKK